MSGISRRAVLGIAVTGSVSALFAGCAPGPARGPEGGPDPGPVAPSPTAPRGGYGPLVRDPEGLLDLPEGFRYTVLSREGEQLRSGEGRVPGRFDGMAAFASSDGRLALVRNHENKPDSPTTVPRVEGLVYDPGAKGGCTVLGLDANRSVQSERVALAGTAVNCAGGPTPWGTWLTCEESEGRAGDDGYERDHGFVFEVDPFDMAANREPRPITAMGRFRHEAVAVDPRTGIVYQTEDASGPFGLIYRYLPDRPLRGRGSLLAGGRLEALRVPDVADLSEVTEPGTVLEGVQWVPVPDPLAEGTPTRMQDYAERITRAQKLEGAYWGNGGAYVVSSYARSGEGAAASHHGQVWRYDPAANALVLEIRFGSDAELELPGESPDNIAISPYGGLMVCEDGAGGQHVYGVDRAGEVYPFARNRQEVDDGYGEFAGVTFSPDGSTLFVNVYTPGTTFAITGPWTG